MIVSAIVAVANNGVIGDGEDIPWRLSSDLKYFKRTTLGHHIIMGRKTFDSIGKPLPKRTNIVLTRNPFFRVTGTIVAHSLEEALQIAQDNGETEVFIIGGGFIYREALDYCDKIYLTEVSANPPGEITFPDLDPQQWRELSREEHCAGERDDYDFSFVVLERIPKDQ